MTTSELHSDEYNQSFEACLSGEAQIFDSFECAFYSVAPTCAHCGHRIVGYGIETGGVFFCGTRCVHEHDLIDHASLEMSEAFA